VSTHPERQMVARNKRAFHDYAISDTYEAGIVLSGTEVKSLRAGRASLVDGYVTVRDGEAWLQNVHIPEYESGTWTNHAPRQARKLLLHRKEIRELAKAGQVKGFTLVPLALYFSGGYAKVEVGVGRGKREYDKRQTLAERDARRETERAVRRRR
jgi:SsrA-binding protein